MSITRTTEEFRMALINGGFTNDVPACMHLSFGQAPDGLYVDIKVVRKSDGLPLVEVARVRNVEAGTTVTLEDIAKAFNVSITS